ncbi:MAG TPA: hypothetical protein VK477_02980, partial [Acidobacteriota bacterium]|nr:hypothetical protein [Acidobacteriota bacterium]
EESDHAQAVEQDVEGERRCGDFSKHSVRLAQSRRNAKGKARLARTPGVSTGPEKRKRAGSGERGALRVFPFKRA